MNVDFKAKPFFLDESDIAWVQDCMKKMSVEERAELIRQRPEYGTIICRCEGVSEGEIIDSIRRTLGAVSLDGVKRRVRQGMGRCQAGFCTPRTM